MYYLSKYDADKELFFITDTADNVTESYYGYQVVEFHKKGLIIYGCEIWDNKAKGTPINVNQSISAVELRTRLDAWRKLHNPWTGLPVRDYLASARVGTFITVEYEYRGDGDRLLHHGVSHLKRVGDDEWVFDDTDSMFSGERGNSDWATGMIEISTIYSKPNKIAIRG